MNLFSQSVDLSFKCTNLEESKVSLLIVFADDVTQKVEFSLDLFVDPFFNGWALANGVMEAHSGREISMIGLRFYSESAVPDYSINIGHFAISPSPLGINDVTKKPDFVTISYSPNRNIEFNLNWPNASQINYEVFNLDGKSVAENSIQINGVTNHTFDKIGLSAGTYIIKFTDNYNHNEIRKILIR